MIIHEEHQILAALRLYGLSQRKIATALEVSPALVSMWLKGNRKASPEPLAKLRNLHYWASYYRVHAQPVNKII